MWIFRLKPAFKKIQLRALLAAGSRLLPLGSLRPHTYRTLLGLLYSNGIRIGEAMALNLEDVQPSTQWLYIAEGKFRKARGIKNGKGWGLAKAAELNGMPGPGRFIRMLKKLKFIVIPAVVAFRKYLHILKR